MSIIQYVEGDSFLHRMDPSLKFIWTFIISFLAFALTDPIALLVLLITQLLIIRFLANLPFKSWGKRSLIAFGPAISFFLLYAFLYEGGRTVLLNLGVVKITLEGAIYGATIGLRFPVSVLMAIVFILTTEPRRFVYSLMQVLKLPPNYAYVFMISLRTFPLAEEEFHNIIDAQTIRGMDMHAKGIRNRIERIKMIFLPLMERIFKNNLEQAAIAMDSRAFGAYDKITYVETLKPSRRDVAFLILWVAIFITVLLAGVANPGAFLNTYTPWKD